MNYSEATRVPYQQISQGSKSSGARLTDSRILTKVKRLGRAATKISWLAWPIYFASLGWEVVQSVVHQPLELTILVRVQASQPNNSLNRRHLTVQNPFLFGLLLGLLLSKFGQGF